MAYLSIVVFIFGSIGAFTALMVRNPDAMAWAEAFAAHGAACLAGMPLLTLMMAMGDLFTGISYVVIPVALVGFYRLMVLYPGPHTSHVILQAVILHGPLFAAFILFCGGGHFLSVPSYYASLFWPELYWIQGAWKLFGTGTISIITSGAVVASYFRARRRIVNHDRPTRYQPAR